MRNSKIWGITCLVLTVAVIIMVGSVTAWIDPFFHYSGPRENLEYPINNQRYQNNGIVRNFDYDAIITGTSLTENFKTSEFDAFFGTKAVKVSFSGGTFSEITSNLQNALKYNPDIRYVLFGIDEWFLFTGRDLILADGKYPTYLYDDNTFNDVQYLLNKEILLDNTLGVLEYTRQGGVTTSFDDYSAWKDPTGAENILPGYHRPEIAEKVEEVTPEMVQTLTENYRNNLVELAKQYPDTQFLYFFPPYSILDWDLHQREKMTDQIVEGFRLVTDVLLEAPNIQVYSFYDDFDLVTNLDNYIDVVHYCADVNSLLLERIHRGEGRLTKENAQAHWDKVWEFYTQYDYDSIFQ